MKIIYYTLIKYENIKIKIKMLKSLKLLCSYY